LKFNPPKTSWRISNPPSCFRRKAGGVFIWGILEKGIYKWRQRGTLSEHDKCAEQQSAKDVVADRNSD